MRELIRDKINSWDKFVSQNSNNNNYHKNHVKSAAYM